MRSGAKRRGSAQPDCNGFVDCSQERRRHVDFTGFFEAVRKIYVYHHILFRLIRICDGAHVVLTQQFMRMSMGYGIWQKSWKPWAMLNLKEIPI